MNRAWVLSLAPSEINETQGMFMPSSPKNKEFDYTHKDLLQILEEANLLKYLQLLQISKPNKSINVYFSTEHAAEFFIGKHVEVRGKPIPFIRKAKRILRVTIKGIHPDLTDDELPADLYDYVESLSSTRHLGMNYKGMVFKNGTRQVFVTHLPQHIPRSLKIGNRWCLVFYRDQPVPQRRPPRVPTIEVTPPSEGTAAQMESERHGQGNSANSMSDANPENSEEQQRTLVNEPIAESSLTSKRQSEPDEEGKNTI